MVRLHDPVMPTPPTRVGSTRLPDDRLLGWAEFGDPTGDPNSGNKNGNERGLPGGGKGRRDDVGRTGVYPVSAADGADPSAPIQGEMGWGQGDRGAEGYYDSGTDEPTPPGATNDSTNGS